MRALEDAFARGRAEGRALLMPFLVCGYPSAEAFVEIADAMFDAGADVCEIGIPFSDPIMDGPVIAEASNQVLARGQRFDDALGLLAKIARDDRALVAMTYYNLIYRHGLEAAARALADAGCAGVIIPDLSVEDAGPWRAACESAGVAPVFLAAQTSPPDRLALIGSAARGFVYAASLLGVTGVRETLNERARTLVADLRTQTTLPIAVGIGVSDAAQAHEVATFADGVIVGTAVVQRIRDAGAGAPDAVRAFVQELRAACAR